jgi:Zn finger protein HypA/HybF involved in hydrogenase expression
VYNRIVTAASFLLGATKKKNRVILKLDIGFKMVENFDHVTNTATLREELEKRFGHTIKLIGQFRDPKKMAEFSCENGHKFKELAKNILTKGICPRCPKKKTNNQYQAELKRKRGGDLISLDTYVNTETKIRHKCTQCEHEWMIRPQDALGQRYFCPNCNHGKNVLTENEDEIELLNKFRMLSSEEKKKIMAFF